MPGPVAQGDHQGVVVRIVLMRTHEQVKHLQIVESRQVQATLEFPINIHGDEQVGDVSVLEGSRIPGSKACSG